MRIGAGLMGPKNENVEKVSVFKAFFKGPRNHDPPQENLQLAEPERWGGVGGG